MLTVLLIAAPPITAVATLTEIEALMWGFPTCSVLGVLLAFATAPIGSWRVQLFSISAPIAASACAMVIALFGLQPNAAHVPINLIWGGFTLGFLRSAPAAASIVLSWRRDEHPRVKPRWRFSIRFMMVLTSMVALFAAASRSALLGPTFSIGFTVFAAVATLTVGLAFSYFWAYREGMAAAKRETAAEKFVPETPPPDRPRG